MGQAQASRSDALAAFYASNGADVSKALARINSAGQRAEVEQLCQLLAAQPSQVLPAANASPAGSVSGGGESFIGGFDDLQGYGNSMYSKAKEKLIRSIAKDVFAALKATGVKNADTAPIEDVVKNLTKLLPPSIKNPKKFHENFNKSAGSQRHVIKALANAINKHYAGALIDVEGDENATASKVAEIIYSLLQGLHTEFMNIASDAMRVMNNMRVVQNYLDAAYNKQKEMISRSSDPGIRDQAASSDEVYKAIRAEYDRQSAVLANLLDVSIGPTGKSLISSLEDSKDFSSLVKDLRAMVGTQAFGDKLAYLLSGISTVAHSAELIDKALKKIGMSVAEFKTAKNAGDVRSRVFKHIMNQSPSSKKLDEMMAAAKIIYEANYDHDAIVKLLGKKDVEGGDVEGGDSDGFEGGDDDSVKGGVDEDLPNYWRRKSLQRKIDNKKTYRELVLKDFRKQLRRQLKSVVDVANEISSHIGSSIPVDDQLRQFVDAFAAIKNLDQENIHYALSGYPRDSTSKEQRELFLYSYEGAMKAAEPLVKGPQGQLFKAVHSALGAMVKMIDDFQDKMVKALTEINIDRPEDIAAALQRTASTFYGSGDSGDDSFGSGDWVAFDKVKNEMRYYLSIANVKTNLARSVDDIKSYGEDYEQILGEEAAWIIDRIKEQHMARINAIQENNANPVVNAERPAMAEELSAINASIAGLGNDEQKKTSVGNFKTFWNFQMNAKVNMVKVAQAIDLYMKAFTDGMSRNPDAISSVVKMLDGVDIVAKWFNDRSGDQLASLFDFFPSGLTDGAPHYLADGATQTVAGANPNAVIDAAGIIRIPYGDNHYYVYLEQKWTEFATAGAAGGGAYTVRRSHYNLPGNPFLGNSLLGDAMSDAKCKGVIQLSQKVIKSMRALENILSAFVSVGSKFGDVDPLAKSFMTPGQIFNALCEYVAASAFATGFLADVNGGGNANVASAIYESKTKVGAVRYTNDPRQTQTIPTNDPTGMAADGTTATAGHARVTRPNNTTHNWSQRFADARSLAIRTAGPRGAGAAAVRAAAAAGDHGILVGVDGRPNAGGGNDLRQKYTKFAMAAIPSCTTLADKWEYHNISKTGLDTAAEIRYDVAGWRDMFFDTDLLFEMTVKAIVAKVFTVVDAYRLFHRPTVDRRAHYSLNPLRTILGGADGGDAAGGAVNNKVKVIPEALELYFRLVLLAEWYRENFGVESTAAGAARAAALPANDAWRVTLVPSIDGIWSDFVDIVFDKAEYVKDGGYSETHVQKMILAVNDIWKAYKSRYPKSTTRNILNAFVLEMNRAFGFLRNQDINNYLTERRKNMAGNQNYTDKESFLDYDLLDANEQFGSRPAPSDRFSKVNTNAASGRKTTNMIFLQKAIEDLRKRIDVDFLTVTQEAVANRAVTYGDTGNHFQNSLRQYRNDMANAKDDLAEYRVVLRMLQSANKYMTQSADKLIMVHEAIATPLAMLYAVYKVMARFNALCHGASLVNVGKWNAKRVGGPGQIANCAGVLTNAELARAAYSAYLTDDTTVEYKNIANSANDRANSITIRLFTQALCASGVGLIRAGNPQGYLQVASAVNTAIAGQDIDAAHLAKDIIAAVLDFGTNNGKLVNVNIGGNGAINIDYSPLEELCKDLLTQVKENCKKLRNDFLPNDASIVDKYEEAKTIGSTRWLEENLVQQLLNNRDKSGLPIGVVHLRDTFELLCTKHAGVAGAGAGNAVGAADVAYATLDNAVSGLIFYEAADGVYSLPNKHFVPSLAKFPGNIVGLRKTADSDAEKKAIANAGTAAGFSDAAEVDAYNNIFPLPVVYFEDEDSVISYNLDDNKYKSLMQAFNKLLTMYVHTSVEDGTNKFYAPLVESFATSAASLEVMQNRAFPNIGIVDRTQLLPANLAHRATGRLQSLQAPPAGTVVYASNAVIIRSLLTSVMSIGTAQKKKFLFDNLAEMPEHLKDRLRVNLPIFAKLFENIANRAAMLKQLLNASPLKSNVSVAAAGQSNARAAANTQGVSGLVARAGTLATSVANTEYFNGLLTRLVDCGQAMRKCAEGVYRELQDKPPAFFEVSKDFLQDYRSRNGGLPLMPFSSILTPIRCHEGNPTTWRSTDTSHLMMPVRENGSNAFKYNFATRLLLNKPDLEVSLDHFPGAKEIFNSYSAVASKNVMLSPAEYSNTIKHTFRLGKFLMEGAVYGRLFDQPARHRYPTELYASRNVFHAVHLSDTAADIADLNKLLATKYAFSDALIVHADAAEASVRATAAARGGGGAAAVNNMVIRMRMEAIDAGVAALATTAAAVAAPGAAAAAWDGAQEVAAAQLAARTAASTNEGKAVLEAAVRLAAANAVLLNNGGAAGDQNHIDLIAAYNMNNLAKQQANNVLPLADPNGIGGVVELTENTNLAASKERLARFTNAAGNAIINTNNRQRLRVYNILDAGIVPLNVHAFMREVPFVNLLNYSYTFDRMVHDFVLPSYISNGLRNPALAPPGAALDVNNLIIAPDADVNSTRELLVKLLVHPYADLGTNGKQYFALLASLFNGNDNMKLGRPRYLSDQLWHKALMTSSAQLVAGQEMFNNPGNGAGNRYPDNLAALEAGPTAYEAVRAVTRYAGPGLNQVTSAHNTGASRMSNVLRANVLDDFLNLYSAVGATLGGAQANNLAQLLLAANPNTLIAGFTQAHVDAMVAVSNTTAQAANVIAVIAAQSAAVHTRFDRAPESKELVDRIDAELVIMAARQQEADASEFKDHVTAAGANTSVFHRYFANAGLIRANAGRGVAPYKANLAAGIGAAGGDPVSAAMHAALTELFANRPIGTIPANAWNGAGSKGAANDLINKCMSEAAGLDVMAHKLMQLYASFILGETAAQVQAAGGASANRGNATQFPTLLGTIRGAVAGLPDMQTKFVDLTAIINAILAVGGGGGADVAIYDIVAASLGLGRAGILGPLSAVRRISSLFDGMIAVSAATQINSYLLVPSDPVATSGLKIFRDGRWDAVVKAAGQQNNMATGDVLYCAELGKMRFDTKLVRNLVWFVQLQRIMRVVLTNHLSWINTPVVRGLKIADSKITEFEGNDQYSENDFDGSRYDVI